MNLHRGFQCSTTHSRLKQMALPNTGFTCVITVRKEVAKVMFLHLSVSHSVHRGGLPQCMLGYHPPGPGNPLEQTPRDQAPPRSRHPPADSYCCGRYASYWNALLFKFSILNYFSHYKCLRWCSS